MRPKRLLLATALVCALAPGTWLRSPPPPRALQAEARLTPIETRRVSRGPFTLVEGWELSGDPLRFGGFSALVALPIFAWWYVFLVIAPKQYSDYVESARSYYDRR